VGYLETVVNETVTGRGRCASQSVSRGVTMSTAMYAVEGMVCESCMAAVLENVHSISGVTVAAMDLVADGRSPLIVTSRTTLGANAVRDVVKQVGFGVLQPKGRERPDRGDLPAAQDTETLRDREPRTSSPGGVGS